LVVCLAVSFCDYPQFALPTADRSPDSFVTNDLMGFPLGMLTGVGFIDAGVIIRHNNIVVSVTTAPTLWSMTVVGLCLGGTQIELDVVTAAIGLVAPRSH
jgi:putative Mg2+ transporter-C (MgtC) family protein